MVNFPFVKVIDLFFGTSNNFTAVLICIGWGPPETSEVSGFFSATMLRWDVLSLSNLILPRETQRFHLISYSTPTVCAKGFCHCSKCFCQIETGHGFFGFSEHLCVGGLDEYGVFPFWDACNLPGRWFQSFLFSSIFTLSIVWSISNLNHILYGINSQLDECSLWKCQHRWKPLLFPITFSWGVGLFSTTFIHFWRRKSHLYALKWQPEIFKSWMQARI